MIGTRHDPETAYEPWSVEDAVELFAVDRWSGGHVAVGPDGRVKVRPLPDRAGEVDLLEVVDALKAQGLDAPMLVRFPQILEHRFRSMHAAFRKAIEDNAYTGDYVSLYPIKVNSERSVVEAALRAGDGVRVGLECGSKPELLAVMAMAADQPEAPVVCNGFKDAAYLEAILHATRVRDTVVCIVEKLSEAAALAHLAKQHGVRPRIGVRVRLASRGAGRWRKSAGDFSKFGLTVEDLLELVGVLESEGMLDCLQLLHCHPGSQLHDIRRIKDAMGELAHVYVEMLRHGANLRFLDVGGGLAVDYDGSQTNSAASMNYSLREYASEVVYRVGSVCAKAGVERPTILTEAGRATAAHQTMLVMQVLGRVERDARRQPAREIEALRPAKDAPQPLSDLWYAWHGATEGNLIEAYHDALQARDEALDLFRLGFMNLEQRAKAERLFWATTEKLQRLASRMEEIPEELEGLESLLSEIHFCNFSVFQSLPDAWAIGQLFPILPLHRMNERPTHQAVLADLTCDSDGKIDRFCDIRDVKRALPLHDLNDSEPYYLGVFLIGAYQEALDSSHNLFGNTHAAQVILEDDGSWRVDEVTRGESAADMLEHMHYDVPALRQRVADLARRSVKDGRLSRQDADALQRFYDAELDRYTYLGAESRIKG